MKFVLKVIIVFVLTFQCANADLKYILNDSCIENLYNCAELYFQDSEITVIKDSMGIILRFKIDDFDEEYNNLSIKTIKNINFIKPFLEKNINSVIIEVHSSKKSCVELKNWEKSIVIANFIEEYFRKNCDKMNINKIHSIGYGEFMPSKNTSYNGGNYTSRVDIMILCR